MVEDENNFDEIRDALDEGLDEGLVELHTDVLETVTDNMARGQDALGNDWVPVTPETLFYSREVRTTNRDALLDTGEWRADIVSASAESIDLSTRVAAITTTKKFARAHEMGAPELGISQRPLFLPAATYAERKAPEIIGQEIDTRIEGAYLD